MDCGSLVLLDENIFISSNENQKGSVVLEINKKLLWSLVPMIKLEYCKVSIKYDKQTKLSYIYIYVCVCVCVYLCVSHLYFKFSTIIVWSNLKTRTVQPKVLKPRPDRTVRPEKSRTVYFCDSLSLKNRSMKKTGTCVNHGRTSRF